MMRRLSALVAVVVAGALAGCGSGAAERGSDPAAAVPRDALLYADVTLRPDGAVRDGVLAAAGKVLHTDDPARRIRTLVSSALSEGGPRIDYARDIDPWLGDRGGFWLQVPLRGASDPAGAAVVAVRDEDAARSKITELARRGGERLRDESIDGVDYRVGPDGAIAVHDGWLVVGPEATVRRELTMNDDASLADSDAYRRTVAHLPGERLGTYYLDLKRYFDATLAAAPESAPQVAAMRTLFTADALRPVAGAFTADGDRLAIEQVSRGGGGPLDRFGGLFGGTFTPLVRELPGDSWAAVGIPDAGGTMRAALSRFAGVFGGMATESRLRQALGIDLERDLFSWMGDAALFVRGTRPAAVDGGLVVEVTDDARAAEAFGKLVGVARTRGGLDPQPVVVRGADSAFDLGVRDSRRPLVLARGHGRVVLAYGRGAAADGLDPSSRLADAPAYGAAKDALGGLEPTFIVSVPAFVSLLDAGAAPDSAADLERAKPYLDAFDVLAGGAQRDGDKLRSRFVAGLR